MRLSTRYIRFVLEQSVRSKVPEEHCSFSSPQGPAGSCVELRDIQLRTEREACCCIAVTVVAKSYDALQCFRLFGLIDLSCRAALGSSPDATGKMERETRR